MPTPHTLIRPFRDGDGEAFSRPKPRLDSPALDPRGRGLGEPGETPRKNPAPGGAIFMAAVDGEVKGCCALMHHGDGRFELAKMAVDPSAQGLGLGAALGEAIIAEARARERRCCFKSNTVLKPPWASTPG